MGTCRPRFGRGWLLACAIALFCTLCLLPRSEVRADTALKRKALPESEPSLVTDTTKLNGTNWMSGVSGSLYLHEITIPGTHDAAMWDPYTIGDLFLIQKAGNVFAKTQTLSIKEQLNAGIRLFDLRVTNTYPRSNQSGCYLVHGKVNSGVDWRYYGDMPGDKVMTLDDVLGWVQEFLRAHPTETVILDTSFESESGYKDESLRQAMVRFQKYGLDVNPSTNKTYMHFQNGDIISQMPTLSDVRGQFLVITTDSELRYGMQYPWTPGWAPTTIGGVPFARENHYEADVIDKIFYVDRVYNGGSVGKETFSNPTGGYKQQIPRDASQGVVEQGATVMTSSNRAPGASDPPFVAPRGVADAVNSYYYTLDYFKTYVVFNKQAFPRTKDEPTFVSGRLFGWVYSDFVTEQTSRTLWSTNFPSDLRHVNLTYQITNPATGKTDEKTTVLSGGSIVTLPKGIFGDTSDKDYELLGWEDASGKLIEGGTYQLPSSQNGTVVLKARLALTWHGLQTKINEAKNGDEIVLDRDLTARGSDVSLAIPAGKRLTIDLAGHTLNRNAARTLDGGNVLQLREGSNLILRNGILKGGDAPRGGGALVRKDAKLEAVNVRIENNRAEQRGGGVYVEADGTFTMLSQEATLPFEPNAITSNTCRVGAGVCLEAGGNLRFMGKVNVTGNRLSQWEAAQSNVYLAGTDSIRVDDMDDESRIGVSVERVPTAGKPKVISSGNGGAKTSIFSSDDARYTVGLWQAMYHADATALYSECAVTFDHADGAGTTTDRAVAYNTPVAAPAAPKRTGYAFVEWCSDKECTKPYDFTKPVTSNMTLYAKWGVAQHTVTFDADNGQASTMVSVAHGQPVEKPAVPTREGHTFLRWAVQKTVLDSNWRPTQEWVAYRFDLPVTSDVALKAQWKINCPTVTFDANGGSFAGDPATNTTATQVDYGTVVVRPATPAREHASFTGWYTDQACTNAYDFGLPVKGDMTLYAGWQLDRREVRFSTFGGTPEPATQVVGYGEPATKPQDPIREGYVFKGWSTKDAELAPYDFSAGVTTPVLNLYAIWDVTVTFDTMDGKTPMTQTVQRGTMLSRPADPEREGYTFAGWYQDVRNRYVSYQFGAISVNGPMRLVARWVPRSYTVSFDTDGGTAVAAQTTRHGAKAFRPSDPSKPGFTLTGWFTDGECTQAYDFNAPVTGDMTLHAGWRASEYTVTFETGGGSVVDAQTVKHGERISAPDDPTRAEHVFCGWYRDEACTQSHDLSTPVTGDLTLHAKWETMRYDVVFVANGGAFAGGSAELVRTVASGAAASEARPADPTRDGYDFAGWCADRACAQEYGFEGSITSDLVLYAKWTPTMRSVTFDANGGGFPGGATTKTYDGIAHGSALQNLPDDPTRAEHVFCGWYRDAACTQPYDISEPVTANLSLYAKWAAMRYDVVFVANGGTFEGGDAERVQTVASGAEASTVARPADPTRDGYDFAGWHTDRACTETFAFGENKITSDLVLYAKWTQITYDATFDAVEGHFSDNATSRVHGGVAHGSVVAEPEEDPIREGYVFIGWHIATEGADKPYDFDEPVVSDLTLFAKWEKDVPESCLVVFMSNGALVDVKSVESGKAASTVRPAQNPTRDGYTFAGWHTDRACTREYGFEGSITSDLVLYAKWTPTMRSVTFDANGGSFSDGSTSKTPDNIAHGSALQDLPEDPARAEHVFCGWYRDEGCTQPFDLAAPVTGDLTLRAKWAAVRYDVAFVANGGAFGDGGSELVRTVASGTAASEVRPAADPTRDGYAFAGWCADRACAQEYGFEGSITSDLVLYAKWTPTMRSVTFDANGGGFPGGATSQTYDGITHGSTLQNVPDDPTRDGYLFCGWFMRTGSEGSYAYAPYDFSVPVTGNLSLYAKWVAKLHDVRFVTDGGAPVPAAQEVAQGGHAMQPADPVRNGYGFAGWRTAGGKAFDFANEPVTSDLTLYAKWTTTVAFNTHDGSTIAPQTIVVGSSAARPENDPAKPGHLFIGWYADEACNRPYDFCAPIEAATTVHAGWALETHEVTFEAHGGKFEDESETKSVSVDYDQAVPQPADPTLTGYRLLGWYGDEEYAKDESARKYDFLTKVQSDMTLHAKWEPVKHSVTFNANGGSFPDGPIRERDVDHELTVDEPDDPAYENHVFDGWCTRDGSEGSYTYAPYDFDSPVTDDLTLYAKWSLQPRYVTFVVDGDVPAPKMQVVLHGGKARDPRVASPPVVVEPWVAPDREGRAFAGWCTADGVLYDFDTPVTQDLVLQARWDSKICTVTFDAKGAVPPTPGEQTLLYGWTVDEPTERPTKPNHSFQGWFADSDSNLTTEEISQLEVLIDADPESEAYLWLDGTTLRVLYDFEEPVRGDLTLHARLLADQHQVTFVRNDAGSTTDTVQVSHNGLAPSPEMSNTEHRLFAGWYRDAACTRPFSLAQPITSDITLYAKWVPKLYDVTFVTCGGSGVDPQVVESGGKAVLPADPTKDGCRFAGWYTSDNYADDERFDFSATAITSDTTLYAKWELLPHAVRFDAEGGKPTPPVQTVKDGELATKPGDPTYEQRDFVGWYADNATGLRDDEVAAIKSELANDPSLEDVFWLEGNTLRVRCDFDSPVYDDLSLHARWNQKEHTVTFINDGNEVDAITVSDGKTVSGEDIPWQSGDTDGSQTFAGWYTDEALTSAYDFNMPVKSDLTLYARWTTNAYTVTFDSEGGSEVSPKTMSVAYGVQISEPEKPAKHGCTFVGWYEDTGEAVTQAELDAYIDDYIRGLADAAGTDEDKTAVEEYRKELSDRIWVHNGTAFLRYDFEGDAIYANTDLHARWNEGTLNTEVVLGKGAPQVTAPNLRDVALKEVTGEEIAQNVLVRLQVDAPSESDVDQKDRDALDATLGDLGCTLGLWLDLSLSKRVGGETGSVQALHETQDSLQLSVEVPASLLSTSADVVRTFYLLRVHDGTVSTVAEGAGPTLEGTTDRFSTYLIAYKDSEASPDDGAAGLSAAQPSTQPTTRSTAQPNAQSATRSAAQPTANANGTTTQSQQRSSLAQTGDSTSPVLCAALGLLGAAVVAIAVLMKQNVRG